jgi:hypothetical protein
VPCGTGLRSPCPSLRINLHNVYWYKPLIAGRTSPRGRRRPFAGPHRCGPAGIHPVAGTTAPAREGRGVSPHDPSVTHQLTGPTEDMASAAGTGTPARGDFQLDRFGRFRAFLLPMTRGLGLAVARGTASLNAIRAGVIGISPQGIATIPPPTRQCRPSPRVPGEAGAYDASHSVEARWPIPCCSRAPSTSPSHQVQSARQQSLIRINCRPAQEDMWSWPAGAPSPRSGQVSSRVHPGRRPAPPPPRSRRRRHRRRRRRRRARRGRAHHGRQTPPPPSGTGAVAAAVATGAQCGYQGTWAGLWPDPRWGAAERCDRGARGVRGPLSPLDAPVATCRICPY